MATKKKVNVPVFVPYSEISDEINDLDKLNSVIEALSNAADFIQSANELVKKARSEAADINDPLIRRKIAVALGKFKASATFYSADDIR